MYKPYKIVPFQVGTWRGFTVTTSDQYGKVPELPVKKGILTGKNRQFPTEEQAKRAMARFEKQYFSM